MKPIVDADIDVTGTVFHMDVEAEGTAGDIVTVAYATTEDGKTARVMLRIPADGANYIRRNIEAATPTPAAAEKGLGVDTREHRTELIWSETGNAAWAERAGWSLYVDAELIAHTAEALRADQATEWANRQLAEGMIWLQGHATSSFYWVASPSTRLR
ncbi:hypothetical protein BAY61_31910 (plasmid) [Prauserella marina]|uniref:Uncharacterized protein n=1 Tax=Prauserella marina TaxID=530584 RepID=A0A222W1F9_9PSEU|nr:hypothetical protein [Prauserella marina]ASR39892.1 hypothetical protein BAY61_31910 [Prauserella marina]PWV71389.1 hypothetical protein DES30_112105 [Prauserella marina]SDD95201.1 hypothetical protein SAMN05421630_1157 [Prauserella marina]